MAHTRPEYWQFLPERYHPTIASLLDWREIIHNTLYDTYVGRDEWLTLITDEEFTTFILLIYEAENNTR